MGREGEQTRAEAKTQRVLISVIYYGMVSDYRFITDLSTAVRRGVLDSTSCIKTV